MIKKFFALLLLFILTFFTLTTETLAQKIGDSSPSATNTVSSFELFWPLSAGKTIDDPVYFLKTFKENLRGMLIFSEANKADYAVYLGTKRILEAEKLLKENKKDFADKTLDKALEQFEIAQKNIEEASIKKMDNRDSANIIKSRLNNLTNFLSTLNSVKANEVLEKVKELNIKL